MSKPLVGAQLFSAREHCKDIDGVRETFKRVKEIGYSVVQISGFGPVDPQAVAEAVKESGLIVGATHMQWKRFQEDLDAVIAEHKMWGCKHPAIGSLPGEYSEAGGIERFVAELTPISQKLAAEGMDFSYHNHNHELVRCGEATWLETLYAAASPDVLKAEIDTYWIQAGGGDPAAWIRKYAGRQPILHLKDMTITAEREQRFAPIGSGNLNWDAILAEIDKANVEYMFVEQDNCYGEDVFKCLESSYRFLQSRGYC